MVVQRQGGGGVVGPSRENSVFPAVDELAMAKGRVPRRIATLDRQLQSRSCLEECHRRPNLYFYWHNVSCMNLLNASMAVPWAERRNFAKSSLVIARGHSEPAGQIAAREMEVVRIKGSIAQNGGIERRCGRCCRTAL